MKKEFGTIVKSLAGHDRNEYYVLINADDMFVYLANGKSKTLENPKKKNRKHVQFTKTKALEDYDENGVHIKTTNEIIKKKIKEFKNAK